MRRLTKISTAPPTKISTGLPTKISTAPLTRISTALLLTTSLLFSCKVEHTTPPNEPIKSIAGSWAIIHAIRNGTDLTNSFDFSHFRIVFTDSTYSIDSLVPFIVKTGGKWVFDDPQYPFNIVFSPTDSSSPVKTPFLFPVTGGVRNIVLTFSPGCPSNSYSYTLQKAN